MPTLDGAFGQHHMVLMPRTEHSYVVSTLQDHLDTGSTLTIYCICGHRQRLSLPRLIEIFGADYEIVKNRERFLRRFRCNECGEHANQIIHGSSHKPSI